MENEGIRQRGTSKSDAAPPVEAVRRASRADTGQQGAVSSKGSGLGLILKALGVYACFIYWGICQEKVTSTSYTHKEPGGPPGKWDFMIPLNMLMATAATVVGFVLYHSSGASGTQAAPFSSFAKAALSNTIASPIGYKSLRYIPFPLMLLVKNCKLIPVMLVGALLNGVRYTRLEYVSVALISLGVVLFMLKPSKGHAPAHHEGEHEQHGQLLQWVVSMVAAAASSLSLKELAGVGLAALNLLVDGFTNSEQDRLVARYHVSPYYMMLGVNFWSVLFALAYLLFNLGAKGWEEADIGGVVRFVVNYPDVRLHLLTFALSNAIGQVFIFSLIEEYGSLVAVTVTITRKIMSILISILWFGHKTYWWQWAGVSTLCAGIGVGIVAKGQKGKHKKH